MTTPETNKIYLGDCMETMRSWPDNCVDAVVTDPPYGIRFMGKTWDGADIDATMERKKRKGTIRSDGFKRNDGRAFAAGTYDLAPEAMKNFQEWTAAWASEALRVLKPGGHLMSFASTRTYHRMASGIEDAGFEIRDQLQWLYGSGFPKSLNVSKSIDKMNGDKRPVVGSRSDGVGNTANSLHKSEGFAASRTKEFAVTSAASAASAAWEGWGTALKPANEPIVLARKPLVGTVASNVLRWGTGSLNIDGARIASGEDYDQKCASVVGLDSKRTDRVYGDFGAVRQDSSHQDGRWPANVMFDQYAAGMLDAQEAGASRFFYVAKPAGDERNMGLADESILTGGQATDREDGSAGLRSPRAGAGRTGGNSNFHPTVKPVDLMSYLIQLVTPPAGVVLDPFIGSGTTAIAAARLGHPYLGCEMSAEYLEMAEKRIKAESDQGKLF